MANIYNKYSLRITHREGLEKDDLVKFFIDKKISCVGGYEVGHETEKPHTHLYIVDKRETEALRQCLKRGLKMSGNEDFSLAIDRGKTLKYSIKEKNIYINTLFSEDELEELLARAFNSKGVKTEKVGKPIMKLDIIKGYVPMKIEEEHITNELRGRITRHVWAYLKETEFPETLFYNKQNIQDIFNSIVCRNYKVLRVDVMISTMNDTMGHYSNF